MSCMAYTSVTYSYRDQISACYRSCGSDAKDKDKVQYASADFSIKCMLPACLDVGHVETALTFTQADHMTSYWIHCRVTKHLFSLDGCCGGGGIVSHLL
ncbi:hypothetical protein COCC4DRAFT_32476 [Bipolaris maydis ATCC 48331]|uniref:Uncharacterized protein n=2 Tax=Cochliobolus heterostrophus TaxID=5016 RepID=M2TH76_COCH5|nr:uncharacterized protein COCC4DRAFT_32476 [Bipolaris maydis ATCC 48331]EMD85839.1 hypothetical protein COCHEDRAFT_1024405 [Bipolaris maydis C5]EMD92709.1 hypothetical protein COCHEDRAFT_1020709 [Bipolaris maydis C5]ENI04901.1 hypothetical protein COCC4DRAFT_32476 [Bipolaris maydis ATCC 48331]